MMTILLYCCLYYYLYYYSPLIFVSFCNQRLVVVLFRRRLGGQSKNICFCSIVATTIIILCRSRRCRRRNGSAHFLSLIWIYFSIIYKNREKIFSLILRLCDLNLFRLGISKKMFVWCRSAFDHPLTECCRSLSTLFHSFIHSFIRRIRTYGLFFVLVKKTRRVIVSYFLSRSACRSIFFNAALFFFSFSLCIWFPTD